MFPSQHFSTVWPPRTYADAPSYCAALLDLGSARLCAILLTYVLLYPPDPRVQLEHPAHSLPNTPHHTRPPHHSTPQHSYNRSDESDEPKKEGTKGRRDAPKQSGGRRGEDTVAVAGGLLCYIIPYSFLLFSISFLAFFFSQFLSFLISFLLSSSLSSLLSSPASLTFWLTVPIPLSCFTPAPSQGF